MKFTRPRRGLSALMASGVFVIPAHDYRASSGSEFGGESIAKSGKL
jgi:hypothetical protein